MKIIVFIKAFWLDFFAAYHKRLMKNASYESPISTLLHLSFIQAVNFNTFFVLILHFIFRVELNFAILFTPIVVFSLINSFYFYKKLVQSKRFEIMERKPKYKIWIYDFYFLFSTILFMLSMFILSKFR